jgi:hypothetical protein
MKQSVITDTTITTIVAKAEDIIDRPLTYMEGALIDYVVNQIRFGLVEK